MSTKMTKTLTDTIKARHTPKKLEKELKMDVKTPTYDAKPQAKKNLAEAKSRLASIANKKMTKNEQAAFDLVKTALKITEASLKKKTLV